MIILRRPGGRALPVLAPLFVGMVKADLFIFDAGQEALRSQGLRRDGWVRVCARVRAYTHTHAHTRTRGYVVMGIFFFSFIYFLFFFFLSFGSFLSFVFFSFLFFFSFFCYSSVITVL